MDIHNLSNQRRRNMISHHISVKQLSIWRVIVKIIGLFIGLAFLQVLSIALCYLFLQYSVGTKLISSYKEAVKASSIIATNGDESNPGEDSDAVKLIELVDDIESICIVDSDNSIITNYGTEIPDFSYETPYNLFGESFSIIPDINLSRFNSNQFETYMVQLLSISRVFNEHSKDSGVNIKQLSDDWLRFNCWYIVPIDGTSNKVCVYGIISVTLFEAYSILFVFFIVLLFTVFSFVHEVIDVFKLFFEKQRIHNLVHTDYVTGGNNKVSFAEDGEDILRKRRKRNYCIVALRLEKYRSYCMYYGSKEGEALLAKIYDTIDKSIDKKEMLFHIEAADFAIMMICDDVERINKRVHHLFKHLSDINPNQKLYFSAGISATAEDCDPLLYYTQASTARASLKEDDTERVVWFNEDMRAAETWRLKVENDMDSALANHEFQVYLQPKYNTKQEVLAGAEALVRWIHPTEGFVPPGRFIPIFEKNGFVLKLDDFMLREVAKLQAGWLSEGKQLVPISVNVSRAHFTRDDLAEHICRTVDEYKVPHEYIELELTESAFFDDKNTLLRTVGKLKEYGFHISMDDFGAGYSSLNSLKELPLDVVKLDAEFFRGADDLDRANLIVSETISLAKDLGMTIVAEGIETREQVDFLAKQDCDLIQGFYFAKPMPISDFEIKAFGENTTTEVAVTE